MVPDDFRQALRKDGSPWIDYFVSNDGRVGSIKRQGPRKGRGSPRFHLLKIQGHKNPKRYLMVNLSSGEYALTQDVHALVARSWLAPIENQELEVNHKDGNKHNNLFSNLEWVTNVRNSEHAVEMGLSPSGEKNGQSKFDQQMISDIRIMSKAGYTGRRLVKLFGVSKQHISQIINRKAWKHVA